MSKGIDISNLTDGGIRVDLATKGAVVVVVREGKVVINAANHITNEEETAEIKIITPMLQRG